MKTGYLWARNMLWFSTKGVIFGADDGCVQDDDDDKGKD